MNEDNLKHIDKTKKYWYAYAESHYSLSNFKDKTDKENDKVKSDSTKTKPITIDKTKTTNDLENIDKQFKYWYAYSESHY
tara:strand:- start:38 stop:277 length:240 start_codon:yes stop_codon:yes gene_type:complete